MNKTEITNLINDTLYHVNTCTPAKVVSYDHTTQLAVVQILGKKVDDTNLFRDTDYEEFDFKYEAIPIIHNVPVMHLQGNNTFIHMPIEKGDLGILYFTTRSIAEYLSGDGDYYDMNDPQKHSINDAVFSPTVLPSKKALTVESNDSIHINSNGNSVDIANNGTISIESATGSSVVIKNNGKVYLGTDFGNLKNCLTQIIDSILTDVASVVGPVPPVQVTVTKAYINGVLDDTK